MAKKKKKFGDKLIDTIWVVLKFLVMIPYYFYKAIIFSYNKISKEIEIKKIEEKRESMKATYQEMKEVKEIEGDFKDFENFIMSKDSTVGIIIGARGSGKSALGLKVLENIYSKKKSKIFAMGFKSEEMPSWIKCINSVEEIKNDSYILVDEGGILFSSRKSMSKPNKLLSELILVARHKNLSIIFISQNSSNLEINVLRQADYLLLKPSSLLQKNFERKIIKEIYEEQKENFKKLKQEKGFFYIHSDKFRGFVSNPLPSFWNQNISKSWK